MSRLLQAAAQQAGQDRRHSPRRAMERDTTLRDLSHNPISVMVRDLSGNGLSLDTDIALPIGSSVTIGLVGIGSATAHIVRTTDTGYGCELLTPLAANDLAKAFSTDTTVIAGSFPSFLIPATDTDGSIAVNRWAGSTRIAFLFGSSLACWAALLGFLLR